MFVAEVGDDFEETSEGGDVAAAVPVVGGWSPWQLVSAVTAGPLPGVGWLLAEGGIPRRMRCTWLSDVEILDVVSEAS